MQSNYLKCDLRKSHIQYDYNLQSKAYVISTLYMTTARNLYFLIL